MRVIDSVPDLQLWINIHPNKDDPEATLWPGRGGKPIGIVRVEHMVRRYEEKAGIHKRVHPHMLRHSRATHLAAMGLTEAQLREFFGWAKDSEIPSVYVHLSGRDVDRALLRIHGIEPGEEKKRPLEPKTCPRCKFRNPSGSKSCSHCSMALEPKMALKVEEMYRKADDLVAPLLEEFTKRAPALGANPSGEGVGGGISQALRRGDFKQVGWCGGTASSPRLKLSKPEHRLSDLPNTFGVKYWTMRQTT